MRQYTSHNKLIIPPACPTGLAESGIGGKPDHITPRCSSLSPPCAENQDATTASGHTSQRRWRPLTSLSNHLLALLWLKFRACYAPVALRTFVAH